MKDIICSKCNTPNVTSAEKCITCGFPFSAEKMYTVGKYIGEISPVSPEIEPMVPTVTDPIEPLGSDSAMVNELKKPIQTDAGVDHMKDKMTQENVSHDPDHGELIQNEIPVDKNQHDLHFEEHAGLETERMASVEYSVGEQNDDMGQENLCKKCGYILTEFSKTCPSCGHENVSYTATMRMPDNITKALDQNKTQAIPSDDIYNDLMNNTGSYSLDKGKPDPGRTIADHQGEVSSNYFKSDFDETSSAEKTIHSIQKTNNPNVTIREGYEVSTGFESQSDFNLEEGDNSNQSKSKIRLEAIYLGQDADQKMLINIPEHIESISLRRGMIDDNDSTISATEHAVIFKDNSQWKIQNKASNKAVFVQVNDVTILKNGDIIMLGGDKFYMFIDENEEK